MERSVTAVSSGYTARPIYTSVFPAARVVSASAQDLGCTPPMGSSEIDEFRRSYVRMCKQKGAEPQEAVLRGLQEGREAAARGRLDLSTHSLSPESCQVLGILLQGDVTLTHLLLSDCMLSEEGLKLLLHGLRGNTVITCLDLKGNNLRADGADTLGKLLRHNSSLTSLTLEWNNLGMLEDGFSLFCDGLAGNQTLRSLDLRNNQINHKGAGELAMALKHNFTLQELDLRWNNIGLLGGRALLSALETNRSLQRVELSGNNIPSDVLKAIDQGIEHNQETHSVRKENVNQKQILTKEVQNLKQEKNKQFLDLMGTIDQQREKMNHSSRTSALRMRQLQETLEERKSAVNSLTARLQMMDAALALSQQKVQDLGELLSQEKLGNSGVREQQAREQRKEQQESAEREAKIRRDLTATNEKKLNYRSKIEELERRCKAQQDCVFELKQEMTHTSAELKLRAVQAEERLESERKRFRQSQDDTSRLHQKEVDRLTRHTEESERAAQEKVQRLEAVRVGLEEELSRVKATAVSERVQAEEAMQKVQSLAQLEEQEKLRTVTHSRDQAQAHFLQQRELVGELQTQNNHCSLEIEGLKRRIGGLQQDVARREQEKVADVTKVRVELQEQIGHLEAELARHAGQAEKVCALERQQKVQASCHREALLDKEGDISSLLEKLRLKDAEIARMREEEAQRAGMLHSAVLSYIHTSPRPISTAAPTTNPHLISAPPPHH
ncbi:LOW QUALITY PROTEIN: leucine-rich repeat-containing protein 45 [Ascaphus truei]|uniref:LOW QUALITY PROTEIN: leucine-rich repeat-containing protein 45 n=1 Tax=Ascaphus truei TaxID=8439 RepID=UPI003F59DE7D